MKALTVKSKQDSASQVTAYLHELGLELLQTNQDEQAQEEFRLLSSRFSTWPYKLYQSWLVLGFAVALVAEYFILKGLWDLIEPITSFPQIFLILGFLIAETALLLSLYGAGQMWYAIRRKKAKSAQEGLRKLQYSVIIFMLELSFIIWAADLKVFLSSPYRWLAFIGITTFLGGQLAGGSAVVRVFRECEKGARENTCDASQTSEENNPLVRDFLKQNEVLQEEVSKYDEQLNKFGVKVYRCWLNLMIMFEIVRILGYLLFVIPERETSPWRKYAMTGLFLSSFLCIYSCFKMESAIAKKFVRSSERGVLVLKLCIAVSVISYLLATRWLKGKTTRDDEEESLIDLVLLNLFLFGYCCSVSAVTLFGAIKVHKIIKERDDYAKFSSLTDATYLNI